VIVTSAIGVLSALRPRRAGVSSERLGEVRQSMAACYRHRLIGDPRILMWGMGGAAAGLSLTTAASRGRVARSTSIAPFFLRQPAKFKPHDV
jgi:hypothetical protein